MTINIKIETEKLRDMEVESIKNIFEVFKTDIEIYEKYDNIDEINKLIKLINNFLENKNILNDLVYFENIEIIVKSCFLMYTKINIEYKDKKISICFYNPFSKNDRKKYKTDSFFEYYDKFNKLSLENQLRILESVLKDRLTILEKKLKELQEPIIISYEYYNNLLKYGNL